MSGWEETRRRIGRVGDFELGRRNLPASVQGKQLNIKSGGPPFKTQGPSQRTAQRQGEESWHSLKYR